MDRGAGAADDGAHQIDDGGEEELVGELPTSDVLEEFIEDPGVHGGLHDPLSHDGQGRIPDETLEDVVKNHRCRLRGESVTPYLATA